MHTDQLTFEALRHRINTIADEGSAVLKMVSSSPVATEANDCNVAIMDTRGAAIAIGPGLSSHAIGCMMTARHVISEYAENPGFGAGDMFLANDPYTCSAHQTCVALVAPVWWEGEVVAWVGSGIHLPDMGGPIPGQVSVGATSIYQEATPMPPLRIVENGRIRHDIEAEFIVRSRTSQQLSLDLRALIAACERLTTRLHEMCSTFGPGALGDLLEDMVVFNQAHLADRLRRIPDGDWEASVWLDYPQGSATEFYECNLVLRKRGERLGVDLSQSSAQAGAVINSGEPGLISGILNSLMVLLGHGLPKCPEAILRSIDIDSRPGTFVHAIHPAGCSKATTAACHAILMAFNLGMSKMYGDVEEFHSRVLAGSGGFLPVIDIEGIDRQGARYGVPLLDVALAAGYGAMPGRDGIDTAGPLHSPFAAISNVETYEARYPLLYLWRRQETDSGGLGRHRGGMGVSLAWTPHKAGSSVGVVLHGHGCAVASTPGTGGGYPGATNAFVLARGTGSMGAMAAGHIPQDVSELGTRIEHPSGLHMTRLEEGDVVIACNNGGGGFGDPLSREPALVLADVRLGAVSPEWARDGYGVVIEEDDVDPTATMQLREEQRSRRIALSPGDEPTDEGTVNGAPIQCGGCGKVGPRVTRNRRRLSELGSRILPFQDEQAFHAEEIVCTECGTLIDVRVLGSVEAARASGGRLTFVD